MDHYDANFLIYQKIKRSDFENFYFIFGIFAQLNSYVVYIKLFVLVLCS